MTFQAFLYIKSSEKTSHCSNLYLSQTNTYFKGVINLKVKSLKDYKALPSITKNSYAYKLNIIRTHHTT